MPEICQVFFSGLDRGPGFWGEEYRGEVPSAHPLRAHAVNVADHMWPTLLTWLRCGWPVSLQELPPPSPIYLVLFGRKSGQ